MNKEKLNELRSKITIPLREALFLLKQYDENIEKCIEAFHQQNIEKICTQTRCTELIAYQYYHDDSYQNNVEKVIRKISEVNHRPIKLVLDEDSDYVDKVGFFIWAEDEHLNAFQDDKNRTYFIPKFDFAYVIEIFESVFPMFNPMCRYMETGFNIDSYNYFDNKAIAEIISNIRKLNFEDEKIGKFLTRLVYLMKEKNEIGVFIVIYGNQ